MILKSNLFKISAWIPLLFFITCLTLDNSDKLATKRNTALLHWDAAGYYAYLPAFFIYKDASFGFHNLAAGFSNDQFLKKDDTLRINKYAAGPALLVTPFFLTAHAYALISDDWIADGYSAPYRQAILVGSAFYAALGLFFISLVLRRWFPDYVTALTLVVLGFGTNLFYYSTYESMMSHVFSFFLFGLIIWLSVRWKENFDTRFLFLLALSGGLVAATRLTNVVILIVPALWGVQNFADLKIHFKKLFASPLPVFICILLFILPSLPHLFYIKSQTGSFFFDTYRGENFFWSDPLFFKVLFSYRKGWLVWSPLILLGFIGWLFSRRHPAFWAVLIFTAVNLYIVSSWWCWWYGGSFGMRALIEASVPMSIGIAFCIQAICKRKASSYIFAVIFPWFIALNFLQTHQYFKGIIHYDAMSEKAYWEVFGIVHPAPAKIMDRRNQYLNYINCENAMGEKTCRRQL